MLVSLAVSVALPIVIAHRGASGYVPEHTLAAYAMAIGQRADFIEPDLVMTKDGVLIARHENDLTETTDVADRPQFADRKATKRIDGMTVTGWFAEDFTLAEIRLLRAKERLPKLRPGNTKLDRMYPIPTFQDVVALAKSRGVGIYPELKHPSYLRSIGLDPVSALLRDLQSANLPPDRVFIQCFEVGPLRDLASTTKYPLIQLIAAGYAPADQPSLTAAAMVSPAGLSEIAKYAAGVGVEKSLVIPRTASGALGSPTRLVEDAKAARLLVHVWTFRAEPTFLPKQAGMTMGSEIDRFLAAGINGLFSDFPDLAVAAVDRFVAKRPG